MSARLILLLLFTAFLAGDPETIAPPRRQLVVWAWERPEDLRFLPPGVEVAAQTGFVEISGDRVFARGRRFPLRVNGEPEVAVVHVQIDPRGRLDWTPAQRAAAVSAVLALGRQPWAKWLQIDFEVRQSQRQVLLDLLEGVRQGMPRSVGLSMTAIASWCETESWLRHAPVDEIAPMVFRMGPPGGRLKEMLEAGGDFREPECRKAIAISADTPLRRVPDGRKIYLFSPRSWRPADFQRIRAGLEACGSGGG